MNAAARTFTQANLFRHEWTKITFSKYTLSLTVLLLCILVSALSLVYVKNLQRQHFNELEIFQSQADQLKIEWQQLLVEQGTWTAPANIYDIADQNFMMVVPQADEMVILYSS
ncbi:MAG: cell division protein FtsL [Gammaproteobacteria bacterium]